VDPHSEEKGRLGGKFDGFEFKPKNELWDRIEAGQDEAAGREEIRRKFALFAWQPDKAVWARIAAELQPGNRVAAFWWWSLAGGLALLLGLGIYFSSASNSSSLPARPFAQQLKELKIKANTYAQLPPKNLGNDASSAGSQFGNHHPRPILPFAESGNQPPIPFCDLPKHETQGFAAIEPLEGKSSGAIWSESDSWMLWMEKQRELDIEEAAMLAYSNLQAEDGMAPDEKNPHGWSAQLGGNTSSGGFLSMTNESDAGANLNGGFAGLSLDALSAESNAYEDYSSPFIIGGFVNHNLHPRIDIGLGLVYTQMRSTLVREGIGQSRTENNTRQYLGLAGQLNYAYLMRKQWQLYGSAGLQADKGLGKSSEVTTTIGGVTSAPQILKAQAGEQLSMSIGTGANVFLLPKLAIYAQGSIATYPLQSKPNLFSQKLLWPIAQVGLRLKL
jgi:hypothetical protein